MDGFLGFIHEFLNVLTFGLLGRWGEPDPEEIRAEQQSRREEERRGRDALMGAMGVALTPLRPAGRISVDGRTYDATAEGRFIEMGCEVEVIGSSGFALVVRVKPASS